MAQIRLHGNRKTTLAIAVLKGEDETKHRFVRVLSSVCSRVRTVSMNQNCRIQMAAAKMHRTSAIIILLFLTYIMC